MWFTRLFFRGARTRLLPHVNPRTGHVTRIDVQRRGLRAKLWFEKDKERFRIRHEGADDDFSVVATGGEPVYLQEAREALRDVGLDLHHCKWDDIVSRAETSPKVAKGGRA
jgi:hypothetical protein